MFIYPYELEKNAGYPTRSAFTVKRSNDGKGVGVYTKVSHKRGGMVARFSGNVVSSVMQHSLQINPSAHLHDPFFSGLLLHSCDPNVTLNMQDFTIWAVKDIESGEALTMDYASTEDYLYRQFECLCGSDNCRFWISGRREEVSNEGQTLLNSYNDSENVLPIRKIG